MTVKVTLEFTDIGAMTAYFTGVFTPAPPALNAVPQPAAQNAATSHTTVMPQTAQPASDPAAQEVTKEMVNKSMAAYVGKGGGRTAATAKAILNEVGAPSVREANPAQLASLLQAFSTR